jgi:leucyl/phenylalanyl-tRNA--protein transferase
MPIYRLHEEYIFPHPELSEYNGLLAVGGDLCAERLLLAYEHGIFPWFNEDDPILWWSPNPRCVLFPNEIIISKSMKKILKSQKFKVTFNTNFIKVISMCRELRASSTWLSEEMIQAYTTLHKLGYAHSVETWYLGELVGGLYGVNLGKCFFGESMFSTVSNASKVALIELSKILLKKNFLVIDCQIYSEHLKSLGAKNILRKNFLTILEKNANENIIHGCWKNFL